MNCPYCGKEMEFGFIPASGYSTFWLPESEKLYHLTMDTEKLQKLKGIVIKGFTPGLKNRRIDAYICRNCEKGIFSFDKNAELFI